MVHAPVGTLSSRAIAMAKAGLALPWETVNCWLTFGSGGLRMPCVARGIVSPKRSGATSIAGEPDASGWHEYAKKSAQPP
jgi:hypothetical protein